MKIIFGPDKIFHPKNCGSENFVGSKTILGQKFVVKNESWVRKFFWVQNNLRSKIFWPPWERVKFCAYGGSGEGINFLALDKSTYQILASY